MSGQSSRDKMELAKTLIDQRRYDEARDVLRTVNHNMALDWLDKLDKIDPPKPKPQYAPQSMPEVQPVVYSSPIPQNDVNVLLVQQANLKNYTNAAVVVLILYFVLWIPGVIANAMYLSQARQDEELAGRKLPGVETLYAERNIFTILPIVLLVGALVFALLIGPSVQKVYDNIASAL